MILRIAQGYGADRKEDRMYRENGAQNHRKSGNENADVTSGQDSQYGDIIALPHHVSDRHPPMENAERAAQFMPFAALNGYEDEITEAQRQTEARRDLTGEEKEILDRKWQILARAEHPEATVTWFIPDSEKPGGSYRTLTGKLKSADPVRKILRMDDGTDIPLQEITRLESPLFEAEEGLP
jgi:hypothetical protein